jgi:hypothetical protein
VADGWFVLREKYCWLVAKPNEQGARQLFRAGAVGGNRARRVDADTTAPCVYSLPSLAFTRLLLLLARGVETQNLTRQ